MFEQSTSLTPSPLTYNPQILRTTSTEWKEFASPNPFAKRSAFDFSNNAGSLVDLEGTCVGLLQRETSQSLASTNEGSRFSLDCRSLTRNLTGESDLSTIIEEMRAEKNAKAKVMASPQLQHIMDDSLEEECNLGEGLLNVENQINEEPEQEQADLSLDENLILEKSADFFDNCGTLYKHICPNFDSAPSSTSSFTFDNEGKTMEHHSSRHFSTVPADQALPSSGKSAFAIRIDKCNKVHPKLYIGIVDGDLKDKPLSYKPGAYFVNMFSKESYMNGLKVLNEDCFAKEGQVITVFVDIDEKKISFKLDEETIMEGKLIVPKKKEAQFYPYVSVGEDGASVSFI